jgi:hypothetical protein
MIERKNIVLVVGAGTSHDFEPEMGTGAELIQNISDRVTDRTAQFHGQNRNLVDLLEDLGHNQDIREKFVSCIDKYVSAHRSVDDFLHDVNHKTEFNDVKGAFVEIGKFSIAFHVLGYEAACVRKASFSNRSWLDQLSDFIVKCRLNTWSDTFVDLRIVTFNYDRLLEEFLHWKHRQPIEEFIDNSLVHVYDKIAPLNWQEKDKARLGNGFLAFGHRNNDIPEIKKYKNSIKLMYDDTKDNDHLKRAKKFISDADTVLLLGYGYDNYNNENLGLMKLEGKTFIANYFVTEWNADGKKKFEDFKNKTIWDKNRNQSIYTTETCTHFIRYWLDKAVNF